LQFLPEPRSDTVLRRIAAVLVVLFVALGGPAAPPASAHAFLDKSDPPANAVLGVAPRSMTLHFTEPLETSYSRAQLYDQTGAEVPGARSSIGADTSTMTVQIPPGLKNGTYALLWRSLSAADGHTAQGYIPFTVGTQADVRAIAPPVAQTTAGLLPDWTYVVSRWLALLGLAAVVAVWPVWVFVVRPAISPTWQLGPKTTRRVRAYALGAIVFALAADLIALLVQALTISGPAAIWRGVLTTVGETRYGTWWLVRVGVLLIFAATLLGAAWWWPWRRRGATLLGVIVALLLPLPFSMISHASAQTTGQATAIAFDYAHLLAASLWVGGLFCLVVALLPMVRDLTAAGRRVVLGRALPRFSAVALVAWAVLALTGVYAAWLQVGNLPALTQTPYGQTLILKLLMLLPLLALGAFNLVVVTRKLRVAETEERVDAWGGHFVTALSAEAIIVTLLLGVVGLLIGTPPAREVMVQEAGRLRIPLEANAQTGSLIITPGIVGQNSYQLELGSGHEAHLRNTAAVDATLRFELPERQTGQVDVPLVLGPSGNYEAQGSQLALPGDWHFQVTVRFPGQQDWVAQATQQIATEAPPSEVPPPPPVFGLVGVAALVLLVLGLAALIYALLWARRGVRKEAFGLGAAAIVIGLVLLWQARVPVEAVATASPDNGLAAIDPAAVVRGKDLFAQNCAVCHGADARGNGPGAVSLAVKPANLTAGHALAHTDDDYAYWITNGIEGTGMPGSVSKLGDSQIRDVIAYLRSLQQTALLARDAPGAEQCTVQPRTLQEIADLAKLPAPAEPPNATEAESGKPADAATAQAIAATARELVACSNAGDILRRLGLYSDERLRFAYPDGPTKALEAIAKTPLPLGLADRVALVSVEDVRQLPDGRVSARVIVDNPANHSHSPNAVNVSTQEAARLIFVQEDGQWRVDETRTEVITGNAPPIASPSGSATPAPR
jgi:copper transport protein